MNIYAHDTYFTISLPDISLCRAKTTAKWLFIITYSFKLPLTYDFSYVDFKLAACNLREFGNSIYSYAHHVSSRSGTSISNV